MKKNGIEFRRGNAGGGNQMRQPYIKSYLKNIILRNLKTLSMFIIWILHWELSNFKINYN